ncbi:phage tail sheath family protein [Arsukibacterium indicum]|uniref:Phage tail sheath subtilisin-like domain-containing protein n=1 Tax=Arsukibacterium indicum TaxID=2848612 RepID=A0ABS6MJJ4_9GAMM|nr:phage tail sheath C-terminal domain-containing protein [Arsukibacterium indicum]MBV2128992.1 phage tail sheath subtilisin-like domain-containing protein [Arsukibacterium indicum]
MPDYTRPGVYVNEIPASSQPVTAVATCTVVFVGCAASGPVNQPVLISSFTEYQRLFQRTAEAEQHSQPDPMTLAVMAFFGNGGKDAYICRLASKNDENDVAGLTVNDYNRFYQTVLATLHDYSLLLLPGQQWHSNKHAQSNAVISATLAFCQQQRQCMLLLDLAADVQLSSAAGASSLGLPASSFAALYYPWVTITNPLAKGTLTIPPAAVAAGLYCRNDARYGVWKAPAGVSAKLIGITGLVYQIDDNLQQQLNPMGINCIRTLPRVGTVIWGARTLASQADPDWRYISVRRTAIFIEQSVLQSLQWAVFEPNDHSLWQAVRRNISNFMVTLFRAGAFQGASPQEAFFVRCGLNETMTQQDITQHRLIIELGFAPVKPAEFVVIRITYPLGSP